MRYILVVFLLIAILLTGDNHKHNTPSIYILPVKNSIKMGLLAGNVNLTLGVKNILSEALADKDYQLALTQDSSDYTLQADLIYFDIMTTGSNFSVFHKSEAETIIRIKGTLYKGDKKVKETIVEESSSEISSSTIAIDNGGGFNQQAARQAVKKACIKLVENLTK
jgi:hypothetical protein